MTTKFAATYNGETFTRTTSRTYTHVLITLSPSRGIPVDYRWSATEANATKAAAAWTRQGGTVLAIVECAPEGEQAAPVEQAEATLYRPVAPRSRGVGHHRRPGTTASYCGRTVEAAPSPDAMFTGTCKQCAKAEAADRVAAEQVAADHDTDGPSLAERAGVRYCLVGTGRRVHYSNNDDTLCGREVTEYTDGLDDRHDLLCLPCINAAEKRAYARALAATSPLAAAVALAETVEQADAEAADVNPNERRHDLLSTAVETQGGKWTTDRAAALYAAAGVVVDPHSVWGMLLALDTEGRLAQLGESGVFVRATVEDVEARQAAAEVTEAEATEGTWRGEWIGDSPTETLFTLTAPTEQGALFA